LTAMVSAAEGVADTIMGDICGPEARRLNTPGQGCDVRPLAAGYQFEGWMRGLGGIGSVSGTGSRFSFNDDYGGVLLGGGISHGGFAVGAGGGYLATGLNFADGSSASQSAGLGFVYGRYAQGPMWLGAVAAYGGGQVDGSRALPGTGLVASGNRSGNFAIVQANAAYDVPIGPVTIEPRASLAYIHAGQSGFAESGAGMLDLTYPGTGADTVEGRLTARVMRRFVAGGWALAPWIEAGVQESFSGLSRGVVVTDGTFSAAVSGVSPAPASAVVGIGISAAASESVDLFVRYQGQFSANQDENAFTGGLEVRF
jgi:fibronectin-binding autotransporter adhesin